MEESQWWSTERLEAFRIERLRVFLEKLSREVPYYRDLFRQIGFDPASVNSISDLGKLPFLTKEVIRANTESLKNSQAQGLARFNTGGSSGEPLIFFLGNERVSHDVAAKWRATRWWSVDIGDPEIVVWGSPIELGTQDKIRAIRDTVMRTELLPAFEMSAEKVDGFIRRICEKKPRMLFGYPSAISHIAKRAKETGIQLNSLGLRVVFCTSERLYDHQRLLISESFGCPVANGYGGRDAGFIAHECPSGGMHITAEDIIVEIVDATGNQVSLGEIGEIVVTHMATSEFPFVRYRTGDMGSLSTEKCACGRGLPQLKSIEGRSTDFLVARDGTVMHGLALIYVIRDVQGVKSFKIIQETLDKTSVLLSIDSTYQHTSTQAIAHGLKKRLGQDVIIEIDIVDDIPAERSGKFRYVISRVSGA
jgi:phenylacetate-CoA ligase